MKNNSIEIIAGPCSVDERNRADINRIAETGVVTKVRFVSAKSRTAYAPDSFKGIDADVLSQKIKNLVETGALSQSLSLSVKWAEEFRTAYPKVGLAMEVVDPVLQLPCYANTDLFGGDALFIWSPSAQQLGWPLRIMGEFANKYGWTVGVKNGKWMGATQAEIERISETDVEKTWEGLATWATSVNHKGKNVLIHRGFNLGLGNGDFRNLPVHEVAARLKQKTNLTMFFDPSHSFGPKLKDKIVDGTVAAMNLTLPNGEYLYEGVLIEVAGENGSRTDTEQHISIAELEILAGRISLTRRIVEP